MSDRMARLLTMEVEGDEEYLDDLREAERELAEDGLPPAWEDVRQELGLR